MKEQDILLCFSINDIEELPNFSELEGIFEPSKFCFSEFTAWRFANPESKENYLNHLGQSDKYLVENLFQVLDKNFYLRIEIDELLYLQYLLTPRSTISVYEPVDDYSDECVPVYPEILDPMYAADRDELHYQFIMWLRSKYNTQEKQFLDEEQKKSLRFDSANQYLIQYPFPKEAWKKVSNINFIKEFIAKNRSKFPSQHVLKQMYGDPEITSGFDIKYISEFDDKFLDILPSSIADAVCDKLFHRGFNSTKLTTYPLD